MADFKTPIVLDTGSGLMKAGFADQDLPNVLFPTIIGMPKYEVGEVSDFIYQPRSLENKTEMFYSMVCLYRK